MTRGRVEENPRTSHLLPHEWDAIGAPPAPGDTYPTRSWDKQLAEVNVFLKEAAGYDADYETAKEEAAEAEAAAEKARIDAMDVIEDQIAPEDPTLAQHLIEKINAGAKRLDL